MADAEQRIDAESLMTTAEVAKRLNVTTVTIHSWRRQKKLSGIKFSQRCWRFDRIEVERLIRDRVEGDHGAS